MKVKLGFKNFYLYSAVEAGSGDSCSFILPYVNTQCMNVFLDEFAKTLEGKEVLLIMDGAGWHKSRDLIVPSNIAIMYLPPYSPELNPVERLWLYIKKAVLYNRVYDKLEDLENAVCNFINNLNCNIIANICSINYVFN